MIYIRNLSFSYKNDQVLNDLSGIFSKGKVTSILGRNGSGKSTLMKQINGMPSLLFFVLEIMFENTPMFLMKF